ncbi:MAG: septum site-determining protein MinD [Chloroflexota bacterium]
MMNGTVYTITSGKGGVGKTTTTANLSMALALAGHQVVAIDADIGLRNLDVVLGLENRIVYDLVDVVDGVCRLKQALIRDKRMEGLFLIPAAQTRDKSAVSPEDMIKICNELREDFDYILIDSPAGIEQGFKNAIAAADKVLIVTTPEVSAVRDADRIIGLIEAEEKGPGQLIINRLRPDMVERGDMLNIDDVLDILNVELVGVVPDDEAVIIATNKGVPVTMENGSLASQAFTNVSQRLEGQSVPFLELKSNDSFLKRFSKMWSRG